MASVRGSTWANTSKKSGYGQAVGSYGYNGAGDRFFKLTSVRTGKSRVYESPAAAIRDGWYIVEHGK